MSSESSIVLRFNETVVQDLQTRCLNLSAATTLWLDSPLSRVIVQPAAALQIMGNWSEPSVTVVDNTVELSAQISGGARQVTGRILTLNGTVSTRARPAVAVDRYQRPYAAAEAPDPLRLNLFTLLASYAGTPLITPLATELTALRPVLATELFAPLAAMPLTYVPDWLPWSPISTVICTGDGSWLSLHIGRGHPSNVNNADNARTFEPVPDRDNGVITLNGPALRAVLARMPPTGTHKHSALGQVRWTWENVTPNLSNGLLEVAGVLISNGTPTRVRAQLRCEVTADHGLQCSLAASDADAVVNETVLASWAALLRSLFSPARLIIPDTDRVTEATLNELRLHGDRITAFLDIPLTNEPVAAEIPTPEPTVSIVQTEIPQQETPGSPVTVELQAQITSDSIPPYDYAWTTGLQPNMTHNSIKTVRAVPTAPPDISGAPQKLTTASVALIDSYGQVARTQAPALYFPADSREEPSDEQSENSETAVSPVRAPSRWPAMIAAVVALALAVTLAVIQALQPSPSEPAGQVRQPSPSKSSNLQPSPSDPAGPIGRPDLVEPSDPADQTSPSASTTGSEPRTGRLSGTVSVAPATVDLSAEGTADWVHWGYLASDEDHDGTPGSIEGPVSRHCPDDDWCINRKRDGAPRIGEFAATGAYTSDALPYRLFFPDALTTFSWHDGFAIPAVTGARTQIYTSGIGRGFMIQVPAHQTEQILRLYLGVSNGSIRCAAGLSDESTTYTDITSKSSYNTYVYTLHYRATAPNQTLTVELTITDDFDGVNTSLSAATLQ